MSACFLCGGCVQAYAQDKRRDYLQCSRCALVQVPEVQRLATDDEKAEYDKHENSAGNLAYRRFLSRMLDPILEALSGRIPEDLIGLDFGSGPEPVLQKMFSEQGIKQNAFDVFYANNPEHMSCGSYDFITATEVVEHLYDPAFELERLWSLLVPGGVLGVMTKRIISAEKFQAWHYKNDPTHVCFFSAATFEYLAKKWEAELNFVSADVVFFRKKL